MTARLNFDSIESRFENLPPLHTELVPKALHERITEKVKALLDIVFDEDAHKVGGDEIGMLAKLCPVFLLNIAI